jgi:anti-sigma factor RsiW
VLSHFLTRRRLGAYLDGALTEPRARGVEDHLASCAVCRTELDALRRLKVAFQRSLRVPEPDWTGFFQGVVRGIEDQRLRAPLPDRLVRRSVWRSQWAMGGALAAMVLLSVTLWQNLGVSPVPMTDDPVVVNTASTGQSDGGVMVYSTPDKAVTVVWLLDEEPSAP